MEFGVVLINYYENMHNPEIQSDYLVPNVVEEEIRQRITKKGNKLFELSYKNDKMRKKKPFKYAIQLYKILKNEKYDAVHVHGSSSMMAMELLVAKLVGIKIRIVHSHNTKSEHEKLNRLLKPLFKKLYTVSFACGREAGEWLYGKKSNFIIIPNGKNIKAYEFKEDIREEIREKNNLKEKIVMGHVGFFIYQKNHEFLIEIFKELAKKDLRYQLVLIGEGILRYKIQQKVKEMGIEHRVTFLGEISAEETARWLNAMDIMIFPSRYEGFPNVLIEWQISGLPCIISDAITPDVSITDLVKFVPLSNPAKNWAEIASQIETKDRKLTKSEIKQQIIVSGYDIESNAKSLENIYLELLYALKKK